MSDDFEPTLVDANIFLRYLTGDVPEQAAKARNLLERAERGEESLVTTVLTVAEIVWVLESVYELDRSSIRAKVVAILGLPGLTVEDQEILLQAIVWYEEKNVDFADCYSAAWMEHHGFEEVYTFDQDFDRFEGLRDAVLLNVKCQGGATGRTGFRSSIRRNKCAEASAWLLRQ